MKSIVWLLKRSLYLVKMRFKKYKKNTNSYSYYISPRSFLKIEGITRYDKEIFEYDNGVLSLKSRSFSKPYSDITVKGKRQTIGICSWIEGDIRLERIGRVNYRPLYRNRELSIYWEKGYLFVQKSSGIEKLCKYELDDMMYSEMLHSGGWYALRSGGRIKISYDLKVWTEIYNDKRGIRDSMVFVGGGENLKLLFIEYSPGKKHSRHHVFSYSIYTKEIHTVETFYTPEEYTDKGLTPYARHIHTISKDPFTEDVYVGTGDSDDESGIYVLRKGESVLMKLLSGKQDYRTLSFFFSEDSIYWNTDTHESQFIYRLIRQNNSIERYSLVNGALWCQEKYSEKIDDMDFYIMTSNSEGALFDNYNRVYGIGVRKEAAPLFFELLKKHSRTQYSQSFIMGFNYNNDLVLYDHEIGELASYKLVYKQKNIYK